MVSPRLSPISAAIIRLNPEINTNKNTRVVVNPNNGLLTSLLFLRQKVKPGSMILIYIPT
jgi:hypothetical protein